VLVLRIVCFVQLRGNLQCFALATFFRRVAASFQPSELVVLGSRLLMFCAQLGHQPSLKRFVQHPSNISFKADGYAAA
jgi:hypothetical protein